MAEREELLQERKILKGLLVKLPCINPRQRILSPLLRSCFLALSCFMTHSCHSTHLPCGLNALPLGTQAKLVQCGTRLCFNLEQKLWEVILILVLLKVRLGSFHKETEEIGTLKGNIFNFTSLMKLSMIRHPPLGA